MTPGSTTEAGDVTTAMTSLDLRLGALAGLMVESRTCDVQQPIVMFINVFTWRETCSGSDDFHRQAGQASLSFFFFLFCNLLWLLWRVMLFTMMSNMMDELCCLCGSHKTIDSVYVVHIHEWLYLLCCPHGWVIFCLLCGPHDRDTFSMWSNMMKSDAGPFISNTLLTQPQCWSTHIRLIVYLPSYRASSLSSNLLSFPSIVSLRSTTVISPGPGGYGVYYHLGRQS